MIIWSTLWFSFKASAQMKLPEAESQEAERVFFFFEGVRRTRYREWLWQRLRGEIEVKELKKKGNSLERKRSHNFWFRARAVDRSPATSRYWKYHRAKALNFITCSEYFKYIHDIYVFITAFWSHWFGSWLQWTVSSRCPSQRRIKTIYSTKRFIISAN